MEKIEREEDQRRRVAAVRSELHDVERGDAVGADAAQFAIEIGLARAECRQGCGERRIFVRPVEPGAGEQLHGAAVEPGMHAVAVIFDFVQPLATVRSSLHQPRQLRCDPLRQRGRIGALPRDRARHGGRLSGWRIAPP